MGDHIPDSVTDSIDTVLEMERRIDLDRAPVERFAHAFGNFVGSIPFAVVHAAAFSIWLLLNTGLWPHLVFDPFPFALLGTLVSCESVLLTTFVLIRQNGDGHRSERRAHLDLQVNLLTEREVTKILQIVERLARKSGTSAFDDPEVHEMMKETALEKLAEHLEERQGTEL